MARLRKEKGGGLSATKDLPKQKKSALGGDQGDLELLKGDPASSSQDVSLAFVFQSSQCIFILARTLQGRFEILEGTQPGPKCTS
jgi:hypothetical protein